MSHLVVLEAHRMVIAILVSDRVPDMPLVLVVVKEHLEAVAAQRAAAVPRPAGRRGRRLRLRLAPGARALTLEPVTFCG